MEAETLCGLLGTPSVLSLADVNRVLRWHGFDPETLEMWDVKEDCSLPDNSGFCAARLNELLGY